MMVAPSLNKAKVKQIKSAEGGTISMVLEQGCTPLSDKYAAYPLACWLSSEKHALFPVFASINPILSPYLLAISASVSAMFVVI